MLYCCQFGILTSTARPVPTPGTSTSSALGNDAIYPVEPKLLLIESTLSGVEGHLDVNEHCCHSYWQVCRVGIRGLPNPDKEVHKPRALGK